MFTRRVEQPLQMDFTSVPTRPSGRRDSIAASFTITDKEHVQPLVKGLLACIPAVRLLEQHEDDLHATGVIGEGRQSLTSLEKCILHLAWSGACQGIAYATFFSHGASNLARVVGHGCLKGVLTDPVVRGLVGDVFFGSQDFLRYNIFSQDDLLQGNRKPTCSGSRDRSGEVFKRAMKGVMESLKGLQLSAMPATACLKGGFLLLLRKPLRKKSEARFFSPFAFDASFNWQPVEAAMNAFSVSGAPAPVETQLSAVGPDPTLPEQLKAIGGIGHNCQNVPRLDQYGYPHEKPRSFYPGSFITCKKISAGKIIPYRYRPRLLHFVLEGDWKQVQLLCSCPSALSVGSLCTEQTSEPSSEGEEIPALALGQGSVLEGARPAAVRVPAKVRKRGVTAPVEAAQISTVSDSLHTSLSAQSGQMRCTAARFRPGQELRQSLVSLVKCKGLKSAFVVTCVGSVKKATLRLADSVSIVTYNGPFEIVSLVGTLSGGSGHLHISLSDDTGRVIGGHVVGDLIIHTTAEVVVGDIEGIQFVRVKDEETGYDELVVHQEQK